MGLIETVVLRKPWEVEPRILQLALTREGLLRAVRVARSEAANATPHHCANAAGTFAYQHGTWALRNEFVGRGWRVERPNGVEAIWNDDEKVRVVFSNVDVACDYSATPKPRSGKGAGAERTCIGNMFGELPTFAAAPSDGEATFYLMVDEKGAAELSRPVVSSGTFSAFIERIYLCFGDEDDGSALLEADDAADDFDPQVIRI
ncbi:hypothetical protein HCU64_06610 [Methylobacterium sp. C25]|uniref:hypothetical protein n=1 Tax=Methylobacterium sp. C25 TaxID=2721622 RepID=UPI001F1E1066|nr:hypothetical protein [Methylobacterium sp. C25]MCE4223418.1 hypothetical protein [Methylobacterium sp. C25]